MLSKHFAMDTGSEAGMTGFSCLLNRFGSSILAIQIAPPNITNLDNFIPDSNVACPNEVTKERAAQLCGLRLPGNEPI